MEKFIYKGSDNDLKGLIMFLDSRGHLEAANDIAKNVISIEQYEKNLIEQRVETERLVREEEDYTPKTTEASKRDDLILWLLNELSNESI